MAISLRAQNGEIKYKVNDYVVDTIEDLKSLQNTYCAAGSTALIISTSQVYMKNTNGEWVEI